jgi:hypothetical protein
MTKLIDFGAAKRHVGRDGNGAKSLIQVTEEEKHTLPSEICALRVTGEGHAQK